MGRVVKVREHNAYRGHHQTEKATPQESPGGQVTE
jgi:hypothetical protein